MKEVCIDNLNQKEREEAVNEIRLLASFRHSNIVRYCDAFISDNMLCIVRTQRRQPAATAAAAAVQHCTLSAATAAATDATQLL